MYTNIVNKKVLFQGVVGFDWDIYNAHKNLYKHGVTTSECEQAFFNIPFIINDDLSHGDIDEDRYLALGRTDENKRLFIVFIIKNKRIRPISFREMTSKEKKIYETFR
jgi:uncharacterized protein